MLLQNLLEYFDLTSWLICIFLFLLFTDIIRNINPPNFPPGPWRPPFVGNVFTGVDYKTIDKLYKQYGDVFSVRWGSSKTVYICGYKMLKEALVTQLDSFIERPVIPLFDKIYKGRGVSLSNGYMWKMQRKFIITHLRYFGEAKKTLELSIQQESVCLCEAFKEEKRPFDPQFYLNTAVSNIISVLIFGHRFDYHDESYLKIQRTLVEAVSLAGSSHANLYNIFPFLFNYIRGPHQKVFANYFAILDFVKEEVRKHKENWDPSDPRDYIDAYLAEMEKRKSDPEAGFDLDTLACATMDMFEAGTETLATTMRWALLFLMKFPEIQKKVQAEIDSVIGQSRQPTLADRPNMPYTEAVIHETQRMGNILPLGFPKRACKDITLGGYFIPKGTAMTTNLSSVLTDKNEWETPDIFNPGHFLDEQGQFRKRDAFMPFSAGKRVCLGEPLARMELFLFITSLLQRFTFSPGSGEELNLEGQLGFTYTPRPYRMCVIPR
ncbi:cytochrome P450 2J2 [Astyanax mexicanus]|uniref:Cytochrome P450 2J2-like n=2 Tax=Astyanax mexicanus TaxID=7994 RepID=A0A8T2ME54_ASTMX|nr:cytochrome P450 2J2 [Astyanax mexicanus]KAG9282743.1 cytochrome P450 2J2-like [Astyanax mexicanus]